MLSFTRCALMRAQCATLAHMLRDLPPHEAAHMPSIYLGEATSESIRAAEAILSNESSATVRLLLSLHYVAGTSSAGNSEA